MLRVTVLAVAGIALLGGLAALAAGAFPPAMIFGFWAAVILIGTIYEKVRYKPVVRRPIGPGWTRTPERFHDPESGQPVTVYVHVESGERLYVQE